MADGRGGNGRRTGRVAASFEPMLSRPAPVTALPLPLITAGLAGVPIDDNGDDDDDADDDDDEPAAAADRGCATAAARAAAAAQGRRT